MSILTENWHTWYIGGVDSKSRLRFLKFWPQNPFLGKFGPKKSKLSVLTENWHTWYLGSADSESGLGFLKFNLIFVGRKSQSCAFFLNIGTHGILTMLILIPTYIFWISDPISIFGQIGCQKSQNCSFCLKIGTRVIWSWLILVPTLVLWISRPKFIFGQIWTEKLKAVQFSSNLAHRMSRRCWFLFRHFSVSNPKSFFEQIWVENVKVVHFEWKLTHMDLEDADSYSNNSFLNYQP